MANQGLIPSHGLSICYMKVTGAGDDTQNYCLHSHEVLFQLKYKRSSHRPYPILSVLLNVPSVPASFQLCFQLCFQNFLLKVMLNVCYSLGV